MVDLTRPMPNSLEARPPSPEKKEDRAQCLIIYTGGTFGMIRDVTTGALKPSKGYLRKVLTDMWELNQPESPTWHLLEWEEPLDSSDFTPEHWAQIATQVHDNYYKYDGFVILHGTDTMAYTASALSFMLSDLGKTVVLTGAVIPLAEVYNDAKRNLVISTLVAARSSVPEVCVFFNNVLLRGNRSKKQDPDSIDAFVSPNFAPLATMGPKVKFNYGAMRRAPLHSVKIHTAMFSNIIAVVMTPGFDNSFFFSIAKDTALKGLVLVLYGYGNAPVHKQDFLEALKHCLNNNTEIAVVSQCLRGRTDLTTYETGRVLQKLGIIDGKDMTVEACVTKMSYLMGRKMRREELKRAMETDLRGELTDAEALKTYNQLDATHHFASKL